MKVIKLQSRFTLSILMKKSDAQKLQRALDVNPEIKYTEWRKNPFDGFVEFRCIVNIRQAELVRQLTKNITVYD